LPANKEIIFHSNYGITTEDFIERMKDEGIFGYLNEHKINFFSCDLGPACAKVKIDNGIYIPISKTLSRDQILEIAKRNIDFIREHFRGTIAVENLNYYNTGAYEHICDPRFIPEFLTRFNLLFILDIAHARISAKNLGYNLEEYILSMPLEKIAGIHLSKATLMNGIYRDTHSIPDDEEYEILKVILLKISAATITIEYYKDKDILFNAYKQLIRRLDKYEKTYLGYCTPR
jgi:uncharacterized protein (UPF0276 family)